MKKILGAKNWYRKRKAEADDEDEKVVGEAASKGGSGVDYSEESRLVGKVKETLGRREDCEVG